MKKTQSMKNEEECVLEEKIDVSSLMLDERTFMIDEMMSRKLFFLLNKLLDDIDLQNRVTLDPPSLIFYIDSDGGSGRHALDTFRRMRNMHTTIKTYINSIAASAASIVFCGGDIRICQPTSVFMVHNAKYMETEGEKEDFKEAAECLEEMDEMLAYVYATTSLNNDVTFWKEKMDKTTHFRGKDIFDLGFANVYLGFDKVFIREYNKDTESFEILELNYPYYVSE